MTGRSETIIRCDAAIAPAATEGDGVRTTRTFCTAIERRRALFRKQRAEHSDGERRADSGGDQLEGLDGRVGSHGVNR